MICVSIQEKDPQVCHAILQKCEMAEIRADLCGLSADELGKLVSSHPNIIITCRIGNSSLEFAREQITTAIRKGARYVDIETEAPQEHLEYIRAYAKENGCKLIISYHNFNGTPSLDELRQIAFSCIAKGADIIKIVTTAHHIGDAVRTLRLYETPLTVPLVAFSMGEPGKFSRYLCLKRGSPYTYVSAGVSDATAPGQYTKEEMENLLSSASYIYEAPQGFHIRTVSIPCSKSVAQRAILGAALAAGESVLYNYEPCNDTAGAIEAIRKMGCDISVENRELHIHSRGADKLENCTRIETGESGLLTRLLIPLAAHISGLNGNIPVEITGRGSILKRNLQEAAAALQAAGADCRTRENGYLPFRIRGGITRKNICFSGKESSQTVSGFLMTLPLTDSCTEAHPNPGDTVLTVTEPASLPYLELTLRILKRFGIRLRKQEICRDGENADLSAGPDKLIFTIPAGQHYRPSEIYLDADWSSASYFAVAGAIASSLQQRPQERTAGPEPACSGITLKNMPLHSLQADEKILEILRSCGADIGIFPSAPAPGIKNGGKDDPSKDLYDITVSAKELKAFETDATHCPDLFPVLAVLASHCKGTSCIKGVNRLMQKESNRAETIFTEFTLLGAQIDITDDRMYITGTTLHGAEVRSHNDHRIAMSLIIAGLFTDSPVRLDDIRCIDKSFPSFLKLLTAGNKK